MGKFESIKFLKALLCFSCEMGEMFFDKNISDEYQGCTCAICGNELFFYNSFRRTTPNDNKLLSFTVNDQLGPAGAGGRMAALNIACEESTLLLKAKRSNT